MLERRNLLASKGVARITKLTIPALCPLWMYQIISQLLLGKWVERASNRELSLAGNAEIILDLSLPGCYLCHRALRRCGTPVKKNWKPEPDYDEKAFLARLQEYPDSDDEILDTWEERKKLWESWNKGKGGREMSCESQVAIDLKPMNQDSCEVRLAALGSHSLSTIRQEHPDTWVKELSTSVDPKTV
ncbi:hypothetical protein CPB86DRAFT_713425 [Serendipita vermifera]|nr:hypothetical protein CPB86DRAFT_713425 [Serendipita vermifera]